MSDYELGKRLNDSEIRRLDQEAGRIAQDTVAADLAAEQAISDEVLAGNNARELIRLMAERAARQYRGRTLGEIVLGTQKLQLEFSYKGAEIPSDVPKRQRPLLSKLDVSTPIFGGYEEADAMGTTTYGWQLKLLTDPAAWDARDSSLAVFRVASRNGHTTSDWRYTVYPWSRPGKIVHSEQFGSILGIHDRELEAMQRAAYAAIPRIAELDAAIQEVRSVNSTHAEYQPSEELMVLSAIDDMRQLKQNATDSLPHAGPRATQECLQITQLALQQLNFK